MKELVFKAVVLVPDHFQIAQAKNSLESYLRTYGRDRYGGSFPIEISTIEFIKWEKEES